MTLGPNEWCPMCVESTENPRRDSKNIKVCAEHAKAIEEGFTKIAKAVQGMVSKASRVAKEAADSIERGLERVREDEASRKGKRPRFSRDDSPDTDEGRDSDSEEPAT